jgi:hypothetical protein
VENAPFFENLASRAIWWLALDSLEIQTSPPTPTAPVLSCHPFLRLFLPLSSANSTTQLKSHPHAIKINLYSVA